MSASNNNYPFLLQLLYTPFRLCFLLLPSIFFSFIILERLHIYMSKTSSLQYLGCMGIIIYSMEALLYFLKGWSLSLKQANSKGHLLIQGIFLIYCLALPAFLAEIIIVQLLKPARIPATTGQKCIGWGLGILLGWLIYRKYQFEKQDAPILVRWAFRLGQSV